MDIATLGLAVDSRQVLEADKNLDRFVQSGGKAETAAKSFSKAANDGVRPVSNLRNSVGQLGYQIQDIAVQLQGGQNPLLVLSQQGGQIASVFGPGGIVIGALLAVGSAIGASLLPNLFEAKKSTEELKEENYELATSYSILEGVQRDATKALLVGGLSEQKDALKLLQGELTGAKDKLDQLYNTRAFTSGSDRTELDGQIRELEASILQLRGQVDLAKESIGELEGVVGGRSIAADKYIDRLQQEVDLIGKGSVARKVAAAAAKGASEAQLEEVRVLAEAQQAYDDLQDSIRKEAQARKEADRKERIDRLKQERELLKEVAAESARLDGIERRYESARKAVLSDEERLREAANERADAYGAAFDEGIIAEEKYFELLDRNAQQMLDQIAALDDVEKATESLAEKIQETLQENIQNTIAGNIRDGFDDGFEGVLESFGSLLLDMAAQAIAADLTSSLFGAGDGGNVAGLANGLGNLFGGFFADGGRPDPNRISVVGERGPELFIPDGVSGTVASNADSRAMLSGGGSVIQHIHVSGRPDNRTANQLANASDRKQQLARARFAG